MNVNHASPPGTHWPLLADWENVFYHPLAPHSGHKQLTGGMAGATDSKVLRRRELLREAIVAYLFSEQRSADSQKIALPSLRPCSLYANAVALTSRFA